MKARRIYYRKKDKSIIIEGKQDGKSVLIWTLPKPEELINIILEKASYFTQEKALKIKEKLERLDIKEDKPQEHAPNIPLIKIRRTPEIDAKTQEKEPTEEEINKTLWEISK